MEDETYWAIFMTVTLLLLLLGERADWEKNEERRALCRSACNPAPARVVETTCFCLTTSKEADR